MSRLRSSPLDLFLSRLMERSNLTAEEQEAILALPGDLVEIGARRDVAKVNEATPFVRLVACGVVARYGLAANGRRQITAFHIPGDMADLHSIVRPIEVGGLHALCDSTILRIPQLAIKALTVWYPGIAEALWRDCMVDAAILMQQMVNLGRRNARTRIAHLLSEMACRFDAGGSSKRRYAFPVTQEHLGDATGLTGVHVNRTLMALRDLVTVKKGVVEIHDWTELVRVGEFAPAYLVGDVLVTEQRRAA